MGMVGWSLRRRDATTLSRTNHQSLIYFRSRYWTVPFLPIALFDASRYNRGGCSTVSGGKT